MGAGMWPTHNPSPPVTNPTFRVYVLSWFPTHAAVALLEGPFSFTGALTKPQIRLTHREGECGARNNPQNK